MGGRVRGPGCQAEDRAAFRDMGWVCRGRGLTVLPYGPGGIPCVLPDVMVKAAMEEPWATAYSPEPFCGGDHYHLLAPEVWTHA